MRRTIFIALGSLVGLVFLAAIVAFVYEAAHRKPESVAAPTPNSTTAVQTAVPPATSAPVEAVPTAAAVSQTGCSAGRPVDALPWARKLSGR